MTFMYKVYIRCIPTVQVRVFNLRIYSAIPSIEVELF